MVYIKSCKSNYEQTQTRMPASDLALNTIKEVIKDIELSKIDAIICATVTKDYIYPSTACVLAGKLDIHNAFCFDIESDFTGFLSALKIAYAFIKSNRYKNILIVATESFYICDDSNRFNDASVAALITNEPTNIEVNFIDTTTDGSALTNCYIPMGGTANPYTKEGILNKEHFISIKNNTVFIEEAKQAAIYTKEVLANRDIKPDFYIPSYSTKDAYSSFVDALGVSEDLVYSKMADANSSVSASAGVAFASAISDNILAKNSRVVLSGYGSGYTKAVAVFSIL